MKLYAHPFSSYSQKVLIALYENATPFEYLNLEEPTANAELAALWPSASPCCWMTVAAFSRAAPSSPICRRTTRAPSA